MCVHFQGIRKKYGGLGSPHTLIQPTFVMWLPCSPPALLQVLQLRADLTMLHASSSPNRGGAPAPAELDGSLNSVSGA